MPDENFLRDLDAMLDVDPAAAESGFRDILETVAFWERGVARERDQRLAATDALARLATRNSFVGEHWDDLSSKMAQKWAATGANIRPSAQDPELASDIRSPEELRRAFEEEWSGSRRSKDLRYLYRVLEQRVESAKGERYLELHLASDVVSEVLSAANAEPAILNALVELADTDSDVRAMWPEQLQGPYDVYHLRTHGQLPAAPSPAMATAYKGGLAAKEEGLNKAAQAENYNLRAAADRTAALVIAQLIDEARDRCGLSPDDLLAEARNSADSLDRPWARAALDTYERVRVLTPETYAPAPPVVDFENVNQLANGGVGACEAMLRLDDAYQLAGSNGTVAAKEKYDIVEAARLLLTSPPVLIDLTDRFRAGELSERQLAALGYTAVVRALPLDPDRDRAEISDYPSQVLLRANTADVQQLQDGLEVARATALPAYQQQVERAAARETSVVQGLATWEREHSGVLDRLQQHLNEMPGLSSRTLGNTIERAQDLASLAAETGRPPQVQKQIDPRDSGRLVANSQQRVGFGADGITTVVPTAARVEAEVAFLEETGAGLTSENTALGRRLDGNMALLADVITKDPVIGEQFTGWVGAQRDATSTRGDVVPFVTELARPGLPANIAVAREAAAKSGAVKYFLQDQNLLGPDNGDGPTGGAATIEPEGKPPAAGPSSNALQPEANGPAGPVEATASDSLPVSDGTEPEGPTAQTPAEAAVNDAMDNRKLDYFDPPKGGNAGTPGDALRMYVEGLEQRRGRPGPSPRDDIGPGGLLG